MGYDLERMTFCGRVIGIGEKYTGASLSDYDEQLWEKYLEEGKPKNRDAWILAHVKEDFRFLEEPPRWIETLSTPRWPFIDGTPMTFIRQITVSANPISEKYLSPDSEVYLFGGRRDTESGGWEMCYATVEQDPDLP